MTEHEEAIRDLVDGPAGLTWEEAELRMRDDDLWILYPEGRYDGKIERAGAVEQWEEAVDFAYQLQYVAHSRLMNYAVRQLLSDIRDRSQEALHRARERAGEPPAG